MSEAFIQELKTLLGPEGLLLESAEIAPFLKENRGLYQGVSCAVVRPTSAEEVAAVVKCCARHQVTITPQSGNTGLCGGAVADGGILLNMGRMNKIREIDPLNGTITAEAGCIMADLQAAAKAEDLMFTLSCPSEKECQLGGNLSTNLGGLNVVRYGNTRDLVLGLEVVLPSGDIWRGLRGLRKDNAGYDLKHLFIGAEGTLGVITAATLKLFPYPKVRVTAMVAAPGIHELMELFVTVRNRFADHLAGFEIIPRNAIDLVHAFDSSLLEPFPERHPWYGLIELNATDPGLDLQTPLQNLLSELNCPARCAANAAEASALWAVRHAISEAQTAAGASIKHDVSLPLNRLADFMVEATRQVLAHLPSVFVCGYGHAGDGNVHFNLTQPKDMPAADFNAQHHAFNRIVHDIVHGMGGSIAAEHGVGRLKAAELKHYKDPVEYAMMLQIKRLFDPANRFNPDKVFSCAE
ncbi:FAD-binding oxidoreductase [Pelobacter seleniigenes]|uniref:FAD-binding oxidoreductase n=1 Tax=Pelobacter seleniigenes TaxID=407188 RepID=UPI0004A71F5A|nr:FAD-binding oxidoreductase [Pelobacter seleniigenes]